MYKYIVWERPNNSYYYRYVRGTYKNYFIGYRNQYDHKVILIIEVPISKESHKLRIRMKLKRFFYRLYEKI